MVIAAAGPRRRTLPTELPAGLRLPDGFRRPAPGAARASWPSQGPAYRADGDGIAGVLPVVRARRSDPDASR